MFQVVDDQIMQSFVAIFVQGQKKTFRFQVSSCSLNDFDIKILLRIVPI